MRLPSESILVTISRQVDVRDSRYMPSHLGGVRGGGGYGKCSLNLPPPGPHAYHPPCGPSLGPIHAMGMEPMQIQTDGIIPNSKQPPHKHMSTKGFCYRCLLSYMRWHGINADTNIWDWGANSKQPLHKHMSSKGLNEKDNTPLPLAIDPSLPDMPRSADTGLCKTR